MLPFSKVIDLPPPVASVNTHRRSCTSVASAVLSRYWRVSLIALLMVFLYGRVIGELVSDWYKNGDDAHGFFVLPISAYLVWRKRDTLAALAAAPRLANLWLVMGSLALLFLGILGAEWFLTRVSLVAATAGLVVYFRGWRTVRVLAFPLSFSLLMIPLPGIIYYQLVFPLQLLASRLAIFGLERLHLFPVLREGNLLFLPHYTLEVVEACSGVRSLMALLALALGYGYLAQSSKLIRGVLVLLVIPLAIFSNALRVMLQAVILRYRGFDIAVGPWHQTAGLLTFMSAAALLLVADKVLSRVHRRTATTDLFNLGDESSTKLC